MSAIEHPASPGLPMMRPSGRWRRPVLAGLTLALVGLGAWLAWAPVDIEPRPWQPDPVNPALQGAGKPLGAVEVLAAEQFSGAYSLLAQGRYLYATAADGTVQRLDPETGMAVAVARSPARALGLIKAGREDFVVADTREGLGHLHKRGTTSLVKAHRGQPLRAVRDLALSRDGWIYFTNASARHDAASLDDALLEHAADGQLLRYYDLENRVETVLEGLDLPAGLSFGPDDQSVLVVEQARYRVLRHWLRGERAGQTEVFIDGLPGLPESLRWNGRDTYWLSLRADRAERYDAAATRPALRRFYARLPQGLRPRPREAAAIIGLDVQGRVLQHWVVPPEAARAPLTHVVEHRGWLYLGSEVAAGIGRWPLPATGSP